MTRSRRVTLVALAIGLLFIVASASAVTAHHDGRFDQLDQQYTLSQASTQVQYAQIKTSFDDNMMVLVCAVYSNPCQPQGGIGVTFEAPGSGASGTFPNGSTTVTVTSGPNGIATAPTFTANADVGGYSVRVTANEPTPEHAVPTFFFFTNTATDSASKAASISDGIGRQQSAQIGTTFGEDLSVTLFRGNNDYAPGIPVTFQAPSSGASGAFANGTTTYTVVTGPTGLATALPFTANGVPGEYVVTATVAGSQTVTGEPLTIDFNMRNTTASAIGVPYLISAAAGNAQQVGVRSPFPTNLPIRSLPAKR